MFFLIALFSLFGVICCFFIDEGAILFKIILPIICVGSFITIGILATHISDEKMLLTQIENYETENKQIESDLNNTVSTYLQQHKDLIVVSTDTSSLISYIPTIPELDNNEYIQKQLSIYYSNKEKIEEINNTILSYQKYHSLIGF